MSRPRWLAVASVAMIVLALLTAASMLRVPDVRGLDVAAATAELEAHKYRVQEVAQTGGYSSPGALDLVVGQTPAAGSLVLPGTGVSVVVPARWPDLVLPNLVGLSLESAQSMLSKARIELLAGNAGPGSFIISTTPAPGESIYQVDTVVVRTVNLHEPPEQWLRFHGAVVLRGGSEMCRPCHAVQACGPCHSTAAYGLISEPTTIGAW